MNIHPLYKGKKFFKLLFATRADGSKFYQWAEAKITGEEDLMWIYKYTAYNVDKVTGTVHNNGMMPKDSIAFKVDQGIIVIPADKQKRIKGQKKQPEVLRYEVGQFVDYVLAGSVQLRAEIVGINSNPAHKPYILRDKGGNTRYAHDEFLFPIFKSDVYAFQLSAMFNTCVVRISEQYQANANQLWKMHVQALKTGKKVNGFTADELEELAQQASFNAFGDTLK